VRLGRMRLALPSSGAEDLSKGVLGSADMDSYRVEAQAVKMAMGDAHATVRHVPAGGGGFKSGKSQNPRSTSCRTSCASSTTCSATLQAWRGTRSRHERPSLPARGTTSDHTELFSSYKPSFRRWLTDTVFEVTYRPGAMPPKAQPQLGALG
jgi:type I restriction enzyme R subunit